jgi:hypothetical protein
MDRIDVADRLELMSAAHGAEHSQLGEDQEELLAEVARLANEFHQLTRVAIEQVRMAHETAAQCNAVLNSPEFADLVQR